MHIHEFQEMMRRMYFQRDCQRGIAGTYEWLTDEVRELGEVLNANQKAELETEFADVAAWLASLANLSGIDLEKATLRKYDNKCPKCGHMPCECTF
jgi:NTP pyrophosphatase (non-canonical NTP hydrolase)